MREIRKILIFRNGRIGDVLMVSGVARFLKKAFPLAEIHLAVPEWVTGVVGAQEGFTRVFAYEYTYSWRRRVALAFAIRREKYDFIFPLEQANRPTKSAFMWGGRFRFSFKNKYSYLQTASFPYETETHETVNTLRLLQMGIHHVAKKGFRIDNFDRCLAENFLPPILQFTEEEKQAGATLLAEFRLSASEPFIVLHPFNSFDAPLRRWPLANYEALARRLTQRGYQILFSGYGDEIRALEPVVVRLQDARKNVGLTRRNISARERGTVVARAQALVVTDGSPMHIAVAVGTPLLALFGFSAANRTGPVPGGSPFEVLTAKFPCSPCMYRESAERTKCEAQGFGDCMVAIAPERVEEKVLTLLRTGVR
ncbi:MAG: glycosyltransferase family 9 protein [Spirochaetes bacterium]|nr:glycosyltransferase family 9 protein [Spirochaetota bacterium]